MRKHVAADASEPLTPFEVQLISNDEQGLWAELHSRRLTFGGEPALLTVARDITHRKSLETSLGRGKLQARITLESIGEGVITTDRNGTIDYMNEAAEQLIGGTRSAGIGKRLLDLLSLVDEIDRSSLGDPVAKCLSERRRVNLGQARVPVEQAGGAGVFHGAHGVADSRPGRPSRRLRRDLPRRQRAARSRARDVVSSEP